MLIRIKAFIRSETVLIIAGAAAAASCFFVRPSMDYLSYLDFRVLSLLFCLMTVVAGLAGEGLFVVMSERLMLRVKSARLLSLILVLLTFFSSMFITNDVALLTFVPLTIAVFSLGGGGRLLYLIAVETIAANLGSMLTPVGNPQNLFLYSHYGMGLFAFFKTTAPYAALSLAVVSALALLTHNGRIIISVKEEARFKSRKKLALYLILFLLCLLTVAGMLTYPVTLLAVLGAVLLLDRRMLLGVDYALLLTFVCFFIFVGNLKNMDAVTGALGWALSGRELIVSVAASQVISNVPAAVMLSGFTDNWRALLVGTNLGGLGTLVASLASLISFQLYARSKEAKKGRYLLVFTLLNFFVLALLLLFAFFIGS